VNCKRTGVVFARVRKSERRWLAGKNLTPGWLAGRVRPCQTKGTFEATVHDLSAPRLTPDRKLIRRARPKIAGHPHDKSVVGVPGHSTATSPDIMTLTAIGRALKMFFATGRRADKRWWQP